MACDSWVSYCLEPQRRKPMVADPGKTTDDLIRDMMDVLTSFCARLHGRRGTRNRARSAVTCAKQLPGAGPAGSGQES